MIKFPKDAPTFTELHRRHPSKAIVDTALFVARVLRISDPINSLKLDGFFGLQNEIKISLSLAYKNTGKFSFKKIDLYDDKCDGAPCESYILIASGLPLLVFSIKEYKVFNIKWWSKSEAQLEARKLGLNRLSEKINKPRRIDRNGGPFGQLQLDEQRNKLERIVKRLFKINQSNESRI